MFNYSGSNISLFDDSDQLKLFVLNSSRIFGEQVSLGLPLIPARMRNASSRMASIRRGR